VKALSEETPQLQKFMNMNKEQLDKELDRMMENGMVREGNMETPRSIAALLEMYMNLFKADNLNALNDIGNTLNKALSVGGVAAISAAG
jgi:hypothetical protein